MSNIATVRRDLDAHIKAKNAFQLREEKIKLHIYALPIANRVRQECKEQLDRVRQATFLNGYEGSDRRVAARY